MGNGKWEMANAHGTWHMEVAKRLHCPYPISHFRFLYGFLPGSHSGLNLEFASHRTGASMDRIDSVMCAKSM